ncbi:hypothetical protein SEUCBS139899_006647 [Sporothrix eucalyptigena]
MDCYDTGFLSSLLGLPAFRQQFGHAQVDDDVISSAWQSAISNSSNVLIPFLAPNVGVLVAGEFLCRLVRDQFSITGATPSPLFWEVYFAPESPWWLVRKDQLDEAEHVLKRLTNGRVNKWQTGSGTPYWDLFKGANLRRTEIACMAWCIQVFFGLPLAPPCQDHCHCPQFLEPVQHIFGVVMPYLIHPSAAGLTVKTAFIVVFLGALCLVYVVFRLPGTKNRTYDELDNLFMRKVPACEFKKTVVAAYQEDIYNTVGA